ncbi:hypothetical protein CRUP_001754 [Coryphaenoides rupestris]|nr:hypothetical protein CRUP_001754 [Coryphaenoides rupestris]
MAPSPPAPPAAPAAAGTPTISRVFRGTCVHSTRQQALVLLEDALLGVDSHGKVELYNIEFLMPGLVDTHIHAPQYRYAGTALDLPLLQWLKTYTYPEESRYHDLEFARRVYTQVVRGVLANLLLKLGEVAKDNNLHIQSHIGETKEEVKLVKEMFRDSRTYTEAMQWVVGRP